MKFPIPLPFTIYITQDDINKSSHAPNCPTAHAVCRRLPKKFSCLARYHSIDIFTKDEHGHYYITHKIKIPDRLSKWIKSYDRDEEVRPVRFPITKNDITRIP